MQNQDCFSLKGRGIEVRRDSILEKAVSVIMKKYSAFKRLSDILFLSDNVNYHNDLLLFPMFMSAFIAHALSKPLSSLLAIVACD